MPTFGFLSKRRRNRLFFAPTSRALSALEIARVDSAERDLSPHHSTVLMLAGSTMFGGSIAAAKAVEGVEQYKRLWRKGDEQRARDLIILFALAGFSNLLFWSGGPFEAIRKKYLAELKLHGVRCTAAAMGAEEGDATVLFGEIDRQMGSFRGSTTKDTPEEVQLSNVAGVAYLLHFHAMASLLGIAVPVRGAPPPAKSKIEPGDMAFLLTRWVRTGGKPEDFLPPLGLIDAIVELLGTCIQASVDAFRLNQSADRILD